jgi:hypothetical protein
MAKIDYKKAQAELFQRTEGYAANIRVVYRDVLMQIINLVKNTELEDGKPFSFAEYGYSEKVTPMLRNMYSRIYQTIRKGVEREWLKSNEHTDELVKAVFGDSAIENPFFAKYFQHNQEAMNAFFSRKTGTSGLNLSQRVWRYTGAYKKELENTIDLAIGEGTAANRMATVVQKYLNDPDRWYRRFRVKVGEDENGNPIYGRKWKRRVFDKESQSYKWIDDDPKDYHPGRGVYRSSYRNAQRLARTETNIAYRTAEYDRWQDMHFVVGIEIRLSNNHPEPDICDDLKGIYPKTFKWTGWHPNCRCYQVPVLATHGELDKMLDNILDGKSPDNVECSGEVTAMPNRIVRWARKNAERMEKAKSAGTLPYFYKDNEQGITDALNGYRPVRTPLSNETKERRKVIRRLAVDALVGKEIALSQIGLTATMSNRSVKEWLNQPFSDVDAKNEALLDLQSLLDNSVYRGSGADEHMATATMHLFETEIGGNKCWIIVRHFHDGTCLVWSVSDNPSILNNIE